MVEVCLLIAELSPRAEIASTQSFEGNLAKVLLLLHVCWNLPALERSHAKSVLLARGARELVLLLPTLPAGLDLVWALSVVERHWVEGRDTEMELLGEVVVE